MSTSVYKKDDNNLYDFSEDFAVIHTKLIISSKVLIKHEVVVFSLIRNLANMLFVST